MADVQSRFDNTGFGGNQAFTVPVEDMIDYPYEGGKIIGKDSMEAQSGKLWEYQWFNKNRLNLHFGDVGTGRNELSDFNSESLPVKTRAFFISSAASSGLEICK